MATKRSTSAGFSLVEMLVTVFIMGLATSLVILTIPEPGGRLQREADRLVAELERLSERALASGEVAGLDSQIDGYALAVRRNGTWQIDERSRHALPRGMQLRVEGGAAGEGDAARPELRFGPLGHALEARLVLEDGTQQFTVEIGPDGRVAPGGSDGR